MEKQIRRTIRQFMRRHGPVWAFIDQADPGFWADMEDTDRAIEEMRRTPARVVLREWPRMTDAAVQAVEAGAEAAQQGCWNCRSLLHSYSGCPRPRRWAFCFGCGTRNVTVRTCPNCGPHYKRTRPYRDPWMPWDDGARDRAPRR